MASAGFPTQSGAPDKPSDQLMMANEYRSLENFRLELFRC